MIYILIIYFIYITRHDKMQVRKEVFMDALGQVLKFLHVLTVVFMSAPLYALIIVNERALMGAAMSYKMDRFMENIIRKNATRCYVLQTTALVTGIALALAYGWGWKTIFLNTVLLLKMVLLLLLMALLSVVHFSIQPKIEALLSQVSEDPVPDALAAQIRPLRLRRKKMAAFCLFIVISIVLLGLQTVTHFPLALNVVLFAFAALFSYRVFKSTMAYGWF